MRCLSPSGHGGDVHGASPPSPHCAPSRHHRTPCSLPLKREEERREDEITAVDFIIDSRIQVGGELLLASHCRAARPRETRVKYPQDRRNSGPRR